MPALSGSQHTCILYLHQSKKAPDPWFKRVAKSGVPDLLLQYNAILIYLYLYIYIYTTNAWTCQTNKWTALPNSLPRDVRKFNDQLVRNGCVLKGWPQARCKSEVSAHDSSNFPSSLHQISVLQKFNFGSNLLVGGQVGLQFSLKRLEFLSPCLWARGPLTPQRFYYFCLLGNSRFYT